MAKLSEIPLSQDRVYLIGRAKDNDVVLNDRRASRKHAHIRAENGKYILVDGYETKWRDKKKCQQSLRINDEPHLEKELHVGDEITIGTTYDDLYQSGTFSARQCSDDPGNTQSHRSPPVRLQVADVASTEVNKSVSYDDKPLGNTQFFISGKRDN